MAEVAAYAASAEAARTAAETAQSNAEAAAQEAATATSTALEYANNAAASATAADSSSQEAAGYATAMQECEPYDASKTYAIANMVTSGGSTYRCKKACTGIQPPNDEYWLLIAEAGTDGVSPAVETSKEGKTTTITITDATGTHTATIQDGADGTGAGDMTAAVYDPAGGAKQVAFADELSGYETSGTAAAAVNAHNSNGAAHQTLFDGKQAKITASGILKGNGSGGISAAEAGTDYVAPSALSGYIPASQKGVATGVATLDSDSKVAAEQASSKLVAVAGSKTLTSSDFGTMQEVTATTAITITLPTSANTVIGAEVEILLNASSGEVTITPPTGVTLNGASESKVISEAYGIAVLKCVGNSEWIIKGDIS